MVYHKPNKVNREYSGFEAEKKFPFDFRKSVRENNVSDNRKTNPHLNLQFHIQEDQNVSKLFALIIFPYLL